MKLEIIKRVTKIVAGRKQDVEDPYYKCSFWYKDAFGKEFFEAQNIGWNNFITFKVRYCKKIYEMYESDYQSKFFIKYDGNKYEIKSLDFHNMKKDFVFIKAVMV